MKPFLQGKKALSVPALRLPPALAAATPRVGAPLHAHADPASAASASVEVVKEGDKVSRIIVTCTCGERIEIDCLYPAGL